MGTLPAVDIGATIHLHTDRYAGTVVAITPSGLTVTVQRDKATRTDTNGQSDSQSWEYECDPKGKLYKFRKTKDGWRSVEGFRATFGTRSEFYDFSF
jgi:hypothetical protein